jgi:transposase
MKAIKAYISKFGSIVLLTNNKKLDKIEVLEYYRQRDKVEKVFDIVKNEFDTDRLRAHSQFNTDGRLFIKFISLILYMEISKVMKKNKLFSKYSVKELLFELRKLKIFQVKNEESVISELSKSQKKIFTAFDIEEEQVKHSY